MNEDWKARLDAELPDGQVPFSIDSDAMAARGRRAAKRQQLWVGGTGALSVAAIGALLVGTLTPGADPVQTAADGTPKLEHKDGYQYAWSADFGTPNKNTDSYTNAFWEHMLQKYPDAQLVDMEDYSTSKIPDNPGDTGTFIPSKQQLELAKDGGELEPVDYSRSAYTLFTAPKSGSDFKGKGEGGFVMRLDPDSDINDALDIDVLEPDSFTPGSEDALDPAACDAEIHGDNGEDGTNGENVDCDVKDATGPEGERFQEVTGTEKIGNQEVVTTHALVHYRSDGSAVVINASTHQDLAESGSSPSDEYSQSTLDFDELGELAAALPKKPVTSD